MSEKTDILELQLDDFDAQKRRAALEALVAGVETGELELPPQGKAFNLHCHSFFSFNGYGYSPTRLAWLGRKKGLRAMALVDFDVLDGVDEFLTACGMLGIRAGAGMETRVFVPPFGEAEINSPGEPGIAYHIGMGFVNGRPEKVDLLDRLKQMAQNRTTTIVERVNTLLEEIRLDYQRDVLPLTPQGNPTERHVCAAYDAKAREIFPEPSALAAYWREKLEMAEDEVAPLLDKPPVLQGAIRAKTMKSGGVGYIAARGEDFPQLEEVNRFVLENGAIPVFAFLDGTSPAEERMEELLDAMVASGVAAVNIIPDRNWNIKDPGMRVRKVQKLNEFIRQAQAHYLPVFVGTEMNAHGQRFVDDFGAHALAPHFETFQKGMFILHAHTVLQAHAGMGYVSPWAQASFSSVVEKNRFFYTAGGRMPVGNGAFLEGLTDSAAPDQILSRLSDK